MHQISRIRTCIIARPESVPHHSAIICAVPLLLFPVHLSIGLPWPLRVGSALLLLHSSLYSIYHPLYVYILSSYATLPYYSFYFFYSLYFYFISLFITLSLPLYYLYPPPILVIFTLFLYFYSLLFLSLFISIYTTLSTLAETIKILLFRIIRIRLSITYFIFIEFIWTEGVIYYLSTC